MRGRALAASLAVLLSTAACGAPAPPTGPAPAPRDIAARLPDGRTLDLYCAGRGAPTILLDAGWSADSRAWGPVMTPLATRYRVCAYDRAGSGRSDAGPLPRDGTAIATDLDQALRAARIGGPFVVVGHSAGGLYVRHFALRRKREVIGMVLVDATVEDQQRRFEAVFGPGAGTLQPMISLSEYCLGKARAGPIPEGDKCRIGDPTPLAVGRWEARLSELRTLFGKTSSRLDAAPRTLDGLPLVTLTGGRTYSGPVEQLWIALHEEIARRSSRGEARVIADSGHAMMQERPDAIVRAVDDVVARAGKAGR